MLADVLPHLECPNCRASLSPAGPAVRCASGHVFDIARQGYVNLLPGKASVTGDSAEMVAARAEFLEAGHFDPITRAVVDAAAAWPPAPGSTLRHGTDKTAARQVFSNGGRNALKGPFGTPSVLKGPFSAFQAAALSGVSGSVVRGGRRQTGCILDLGAGTGHYLAAVLSAAPDAVGIALEIAKPALRRAARAHPRLGAVGADTWGRLPVRDGAISLALNVFAPRNAAELHRVLAPGGRLVVVSPTVAHLAPLVSELELLTVAPDKAARLAATLEPWFSLSTQDECAFNMSLRHKDVLRLVAMGPSAWHVDQEAVRSRVAALPEPVTVPASVLVTTFGKGER